MKEETAKHKAWRYSKRFLRAIVPQIPTLLALSNVWFNPEYAPIFIFGGSVLTALDKMLRDMKLY